MLLTRSLRRVQLHSTLFGSLWHWIHFKCSTHRKSTIPHQHARQALSGSLAFRFGIIDQAKTQHPSFIIGNKEAIGEFRCGVMSWMAFTFRLSAVWKSTGNCKMLPNCLSDSVKWPGQYWKRYQGQQGHTHPKPWNKIAGCWVFYNAILEHGRPENVVVNQDVVKFCPFPCIRYEYLADVQGKKVEAYQKRKADLNQKLNEEKKRTCWREQ